MTTGTELQLLSVSQHEQFLRRQSERLNNWCLPASNMRSDMLIRHALHEMSIDASLQACTPTSIYLALMACAVTGLVPGKMKSLAFLIPFKNTKKIVDANGHGKEVTDTEATFMIGWRGIKHTGYRAGLDMVSAVIHANDDFDFDKGTTPFVRYKPALRGAGQIIGTACWVKLPRGGLEIEYLDMEELGKIETAAKAKGGGKSPAWDGPFKDQMQRKSALRRLGKQIEMGEDFHRAELIENTYADAGSIAGAIDIITDGEATRALSAASTEAAVFGGAPRPAQVQVPAQLQAAPAPAPQPISKPRQASPPAKPAPTTPANTAKAELDAAAKLDEAKAKVEAKRPPAASTSPSGTPATASDGGTPPARSAASPTAGAAGSTAHHSQGSPAVSSPASSGPASNPSTSSESTPAPSTGSSSSASTEEDSGRDLGDFGDVAAEPGPDEDFDSSFGDEAEDPARQPPVTRQEWVAAFQAWAAEHPTREAVLADASWLDVFRGWCAVCHTKAELDADKPVFINWAKGVFSLGRKADPAKGLSEIKPDTGSADMQKIFAHRYKQVP